jgi:hypothetical protein
MGWVERTDGTGAIGVICETVWDKLHPQDPGGGIVGEYCTLE